MKWQSVVSWVRSGRIGDLFLSQTKATRPHANMLLVGCKMMHSGGRKPVHSSLLPILTFQNTLSARDMLMNSKRQYTQNFASKFSSSAPEKKQDGSKILGPDSVNQKSEVHAKQNEWYSDPKACSMPRYLNTLSHGIQSYSQTKDSHQTDTRSFLQGACSVLGITSEQFALL
jgi:hypothetical protein